MNLVETIADIVWDGCEAEVSAQGIAEHVIEKLGLEQTYASATVLHDGYVQADTQWEYDDYDAAKKYAKLYDEGVATRAVGRWVMVDDV